MIDRQPLTNKKPLVESVVVRFRDKKTGEWIEGISEPKIDPNHFRIWLSVKSYEPCRFAHHRGRECGCKKKLTGVREGPANLLTNGFAALVQANILNNAPTNQIKDTGGTLRSITANTATSALTGAAGTTGTTAAVTDFALGTETETQATVTVNANPNTGTTSGTFTVTFTITAGADRAYAEVGLKITKATFVFLVCHDTFSVLNVSNTGTLAVTYTFTNS